MPESAAIPPAARDLLLDGRYLEGFQAYEDRASRLNSELRGLPYPEWDGSPLAGRSILVWGEQGIGDEIQMARFVPRLRQLGAGKISLACHNWNVRAFAQLGADHVFSRTERSFVPHHDAWVLLGSLPQRLGVTLETLAGTPYLRAQPSARGGIGLVERGNPAHPFDTYRSMPEGLLQHAVPDGFLLRPEGDIAESLRQVSGLNLLITVDTSWAHMAGALGVPCWVLLPYIGLDWRWLRGRPDSPWYDSIRLYRQPSPGDWTTPLALVSADITEQRSRLAAHI